MTPSFRPRQAAVTEGGGAGSVQDDFLRRRGSREAAAGGLFLVALLLCVPRAIAVTRIGTSPLAADHVDTEGPVLAPFEFRSGVVVNPVRRIAYLMRPGGGIEAVDLSSGRLVWFSDAAARPLLLRDERLLAQVEPTERGNVVRLTVLSATEGKPVLPVEEMALPEGVSSSVEDGPGTSFRLSGLSEGPAALISWEYSRQYVGGRAPGPEDKARERQASGTFRIDLRTGHAELGGSSTREGRTRPQSTLPASLKKLMDSNSLPGPLWNQGKVFATAFPGVGPEKDRITLRRWDAQTGTPLTDVVLSAEGLTIRYASADNQHLLASRRASAPCHRATPPGPGRERRSAAVLMRAGSAQG